MHAVPVCARHGRHTRPEPVLSTAGATGAPPLRRGGLADCPCHRVAWGHGQPGPACRSRRRTRGPRGRPRGDRAAARGPVAGGVGAGRGTPQGAGGAAHRVGQVGGVLRGHGPAAEARRRTHGDHLAAARADAQPGRVGGQGRHQGAHHQLGQPGGVGGHPRGGAARRDRRAPGKS
ncbi:hypothetical protein SBRY_60527 [Actinacidiphila bryophytorum]|uniref:Uncharacterized protein n=1 Tax=Actinacidiphila bryophytorum TaxID=1436133 RepID=A0A9W4H6L6_9ACTN|nr:hypothetical protein SBRY_60527 [Actinacidiphila bryophytorum]